ncbi:MAG: T9SS type A sorting domain-containing protein [Chitinophagaceae bacterium]|nr:T9SS type A sorting domain-containing protein [Chitinophagaceae bacterium]
MKKILFATIMVALATALPKFSKAQAPDTSTIDKLQRYVAGPLDKTQVPTGFLEDYGAPFIPMTAFNGNLSDSNKIEMSLWRLLYFQLQTSYCQAGTNPLPSIVTVNTALQNAGTSAIPISLLLGQYAKVKTDAYTNNLLYFNSTDKRVYDVAGRNRSPYTTNYLFAAAPLQANNVTNTASFVYNPNLVWSNTGLSISQLQVNFDDGQGLRTLAPNTPVNITYADSGYHTLTIKATLSNNVVLQCYSSYYVLTVSNTQARYMGANIVNPPWGTIAPVPGVHGGGTISYILSTTNTTGLLKKPLIVAENMDIFGIAPKLQDRPYNLDQLLTSIQNTVTGGYDFNDALDVAQYDLVFVNFTKGEDGVVNNAQVFKDAITKINTNKSGSLQNVVLGIGTGGIVARYALAEVTKQLGGNPTQTRLLITHDAPHRGANIALGIQMMTRMLASYNYFGITTRQIFPEYGDAMRYYDAPINQDILFYRSTSDENFNTNTFISNVYQPMVNYISPYKFVATILGNECANQLMPAGSKFIDMGMEVYAKLKGKVLWGLVGVTLLKVNYETLIYARAVPTASDGNRKIASVKCVFALKLFGAINIVKTGYDKTVSAGTSIIPYDGVPGSNQQTLSFGSLREYYNALEYLSGASTVINTTSAVIQYIQAIQKAIKAIKAATTLLEVLQSPGFFKLSLVPGFNAETQSFYTEYTYLPVGSALDVTPFDAGSFTAKFVNGANPSYPSPAATYIAQESVPAQSLYNNASMRFTARNARFLFNEMEGVTPNNEVCSQQCQPSGYSISGPGAFCTGPQTYRVNGLPPNGIVTWTVIPTGIVSTTINADRSITLQKLQDGFVTLSASLNSCNQTTPLSLNVIAGTPIPGQFFLYGQRFNYASNGPGNSFSVCPSEALTFVPTYDGNNSVAPPGTTAHEWTISGSYSFASSLNQEFLALMSASAHPNAFQFTYRYQNACGWSAPIYGQAGTMNCDGGEEPFRVGAGSFDFSITPNPAKNTALLTLTGVSSAFEVKFFDLMTSKQEFFLRFVKGQTQVQLNLSNLKAGNYVVQITSNGVSKSKKLQILQ